MPAALVPRPWDFDLPPGTPDLVPIHEEGPLKQIPSHGRMEDESGRPSGDLPPVIPHDNLIPASPSPEPNNPGTDNGTLTSSPGVTIIPPTLRGSPPSEVQLQA